AGPRMNLRRFRISRRTPRKRRCRMSPEKNDMKRREMLQKAGLAAGAMALPKWVMTARSAKVDCIFQLSVITDEISHDFGHALEVAADEFGLGFVELRGLWKKNI